MLADINTGTSLSAASKEPMVSAVMAWAISAPLMEEMQRLIVHGTLHLCGYDHHERREAARMHGLTRRLLRDLRLEDDNT